jgi:hypothetical protein
MKLALLALVTLVGTTEAAPCAVQYPEVSIHTLPETELPADGGVILAVGSVHESKAPSPFTWKLAGGRRKASTATVIAPGLEVVKLIAGAVELGNARDRRAIKRTTAKPATLPAPDVKSIAFVKGRRNEHVAVELAAPQAGAFAIVIADAKTKQPRSWGFGAGTTVYPYRSGGCQARADGTARTTTGDEVVLFWLDEYGRVSASTGPMKVQ